MAGTTKSASPPSSKVTIVGLVYGLKPAKALILRALTETSRDVFYIVEQPKSSFAFQQPLMAEIHSLAQMPFGFYMRVLDCFGLFWIVLDCFYVR